MPLELQCLVAQVSPSTALQILLAQLVTSPVSQVCWRLEALIQGSQPSLRKNSLHLKILLPDLGAIVWLV